MDIRQWSNIATVIVTDRERMMTINASCRRRMGLFAIGALLAGTVVSAASAQELSHDECLRVGSYCYANYAGEGYESPLACYDDKMIGRTCAPPSGGEPGEDDYDRKLLPGPNGCSFSPYC